MPDVPERAIAPPLVLRTDLAPAPSTDDGHGELLASLSHLSDLHVMDAASPMRFEWIETLAHDPRWRPLLHMHRPQETLVPWAVAAHVSALRERPMGATRGDRLDLVVFTGDNIDNAQQNELDAYLSLVAGGTSTLSAVGSAQDAIDVDLGQVWPYWCPKADVADSWKPRGYPAIDDLVERTSEPLTSAGLGLRWTSLQGNHDVLCQGTSFVNDALTAAATGATKALWPLEGFEPDDVLTLFVDHPERFLGVGRRPISPDPRRRGLTRRDWIAGHVAAGATGWTSSQLDAESTDTVIELDAVSVVVLDTNHPDGDYQGSVGQAQLDWLDDVLTRADDAARWVVLASHHGVDTLVNTRGDDPSRRLAAPMLDVVHRHPCVVAWLVGHRHIHRITPRPGAAGGFWEITTASIIDWPVERRSVEVLRHRDGTIEITCVVHPHDADPTSLAGIHLDIAQRFGGSQVRSAMAGSDLDRNVRLFLRR
jgi:metallophosphoesterase (TIGR03767 family)